MQFDQNAAVLKILKRREGQPTEVTLSSGAVLQVFNVHWCYDLGDPIALVTTNDNPTPEEKHTVDLFSTEEVVRIVDPETGTVWFDVVSSDQ